MVVAFEVTCILVGWLGFADPGAGHGAEADALVKQGIELRRAGKDEEALKDFQRAQALRPSPRGRAQVGLAEQALGQWVAAEADLEGALKAADDPWIARNRATLKSSLKLVREHVGGIVILGSPDGARVAIDGRDVGVLPLVEPVHVATGEVLVKVEAPGYESIARKVTVSTGLARETINLPPIERRPPVESGVAAGGAAKPPASVEPGAGATAKPPAADVPAGGSRAGVSPPSHDGVRTASYIVGGAGVVALGVGGIFGWRAFAKWSDRNDHCPGGDAHCDDTAVSDYASAHDAAIIADVAIGVGIASVATAAVLWLRSRPAEPAPGSASAATGITSLSLARPLGGGSGSLVIGGNW